jgi:uncharacterized membrane protein YgdD (TMEM256/DUF423 family)
MPEADSTSLMQPRWRTLCAGGALLVALATMIGAMGAHVFKPRLSLDRYEVLQTAVHYQFFQALGLVLIGMLAERVAAPLLRTAGALLLIGVVLFSGSLYLLVAGAPTWIGLVTPIGGVFMIVAWLIAVGALWHTQRR